MPEGNIFGSDHADEFAINIDGKRKGVFKRFEYLSLPFSITGNEKKFNQLLHDAEKNGTSFREELEKDQTAVRIVNLFFEKMTLSPAFSKQVLDHSLGRMYVEDNLLVHVDERTNLEDHLAKVVISWKHLADFYCIEGLVGGDGEINPFKTNERTSFFAGALDSLETILPSLRMRVEPRKWTEVCLKLSSVVGRSYVQINRAVDVLKTLVGKEKELSAEEVEQFLQLVDDVSTSTFDTQKDIGKLYNSLIRFHNWLPLAMKQSESQGDVYDGICIPTKRALELLSGSKEIEQALSGIRDATSPKGLALVMLADEEKLGSREALIQKIDELEQRIEEQSAERRKDFFTFSFDDPSFYTGLSGGKWKGLKLLQDAKEALHLQYYVPRGFVISSIAVEKTLDERLKEILKEDIFYLDEERREQILVSLQDTSFEQCFDPEQLTEVGDTLLVRSSMYGEDGCSNFSGTYESVACDRSNVGEAIREVVKSYFSAEAVQSREDVGLAHLPGISIVIQQRIKGRGGVIHLTKNNYSISFAENPEEAVLGNGTHTSAQTLKKALEGTPLERVQNDLNALHTVFGNSDIEFVLDREDNIYFTQLRPKYTVPKLFERNIDAERIEVQSIQELSNMVLETPCIVSMSFLGKENMMNKEGEIMNFIRRNRRYVVAVEGNMPCVAHIPNKIEGHFKIPYIFGGTNNDI